MREIGESCAPLPRRTMDNLLRQLDGEPPPPSLSFFLPTDSSLRTPPPRSQFSSGAELRIRRARGATSAPRLPRTRVLGIRALVPSLQNRSAREHVCVCVRACVEDATEMGVCVFASTFTSLCDTARFEAMPLKVSLFFSGPLHSVLSLFFQNHSPCVSCRFSPLLSLSLPSFVSESLFLPSFRFNKLVALETSLLALSAVVAMAVDVERKE